MESYNFICFLLSLYLSPDTPKEMIDRVVTQGGATLFFNEITNLLKGEYMKKRQDFPLTAIPEL